MTAGRYDRLVIEQGATFELPMTWEKPIDTPWDFTGCVFRASVRANYAAASALLDFDVQVISATGGQIKLYASASATDAMPIGDVPQGFYPAVWDLEVVLAPTADGVVRRLLEGRAKIKPQASQ